MLKKYAAFLILAAMAAWTAPAALAQDLQTVLAASSHAMGADNLKSVEFTGSGWEYTFGQAFNPSSPWGGYQDRSYTRTINFEKPSWHIDRVLAPIPADRLGGGLPPALSQTVFITPNTNWAAQLDHWMLPYAFLKAAATYNATLASQKTNGKHYTVVTFLAPNKAKVSGYINDQNMVERVETTIDNPVTGDTPLVSTYTDYKDFGGLKFPTRIVRTQGDWPILDLTVPVVMANVQANFTPPPAGGGGGGQPLAVVSRPLGDGVYLILGGYASIAVDFKDYIVVLECGNSEANASAIIAEAKRLIPNKPVKYLFNTHSHFDHSSGVRRFMAEGATIITYQGNKQYFEKLATSLHTLNPDMLAQSPKKPSVEGMGDKKILTDGNHVIELYRLRGNTHSEGLSMAYLPKEKALLEADAWNPPNDADAAPGPLNNALYNHNLVDNIKRLNLNVETIVPVHYPPNNRPVTMAEFTRAVDKLPN